MKHIFDVLYWKQAELERIHKELEALRIAAALLSDGGEQRSTIVSGTPISSDVRTALAEHASFTKRQEWVFPGRGTPIRTSSEQSQHDPRAIRDASSPLLAIGEAIPSGAPHVADDAGQICDVCGRTALN